MKLKLDSLVLFLVLILAIIPTGQAFLTPNSIITKGKIQSKRSFFSKTAVNISRSFSPEELERLQAEWERRELIAETQIFGNMNEGEIARIAALADSVKVAAGERIIQQGDKANEAYIVVSGIFECYDENDPTTVITSVSPGTSFGDLGAIRNEKRALSVRAAQDGELLMITKDDMTKSLENAAIKVDEILQTKYSTYFDDRLLAKSIKKCPLFKGIVPEDLKRIQDSMTLEIFQKEQIVFHQGEEGSSMYFVKSGSFGCFDEDGTLVATINEGGFFGELAIVLKTTRALTIRALEDSALFRLEEEAFLDSVMESGLFESAIATVKDSYGLTSIWDIVSTLSYQELLSLAVTASRPRKASVSTHSTISSVAAGLFVAALISMFSPGFYPNGWPRIYDPMLFTDVGLTRAVSFLFCVVGVTGAFRLPPRTPRLRRLLFQQNSWISVVAWMSQDCNLNIAGDRGYTWDFSNPIAAAVYLAVFHIIIYGVYEIVYETIGGEKKGREAILLSEDNEFIDVSAQLLVLYGMIVAFLPAVLVQDQALLAQEYFPGIVAADGFFLTANMILTGFIGFGMLFASLLFEKKINRTQAQALVFLDFFLSGMYDSTIAAVDPIQTNLGPEGMAKFQKMLEFIGEIQQIQLRQYDLGVGLFISAIFFGIRAKVEREKNEVGALATENGGGSFSTNTTIAAA